MNSRRIALSLIVSTFALAARPASSEPVRIGMLLPLSGAYQAVGADNQAGIAAAMKLGKGKDLISLEFADSKADPVSAVNEFRRLVDASGVVSLFAMRGPVGMAINPVAKSIKFPILGGVGDKRFAASNEYAFQLWPRSDEEGSYLAEVISREHGKVALVTSRDDWTDAVSRGFRSRIGAGGIIFDEEIEPSDTDFRTLLLKMKKKAPEAAVANLSLSQIGPFFKQARELGISASMFSNFWIAKKDVIQSVPEGVLDGVRFVEMDTNLPRFIEQLGSGAPSGATLTAYVATFLFMEAAAEPGAAASPAAFYDALRKQSSVVTPDRTFEIKDRCVRFPMSVRVMKGGKAESAS